jgi:toxin ParE1/3/4
MSRPDLRVVLSPKAEDDFTDILQYTLEIWGEQQMLAYRSLLHEAFLSLRDNPGMGPRRPEISPEHRVLPAGQHFIIYRVTEHAIQVSRILHGRMDVRRQMEPGDDS